MRRSGTQAGAVLLAAALVIGCSDDAGTGSDADETASETGASSETSSASEGGDTGDTGGDPSDTGDTGDGDGDGDTGETGDPGPAGVFVAVGDGGRRASSSDGVEWATIIGSGVVDTQAEVGEEDILRAVAAGDGVVVAVGGGGTDWTGNAMIMRSSDGVTWTEDLVGGQGELDERKLTAVGFVDGVFIAAGHQSHILRSSDAGQTWARVYPEHHASTTVFGVAGHGDLIVLVGLHQDAWDQPKVAYVQRSSDAGQSFAAPEYFGSDGDQLTSIASDGVAVFVAVGPQQCLRSGDGVAWDPCGLGATGYGAVSFTNSRFVVTYLDGVSTSSDGEDWSVHVESATGVPTEVVYGNGVYAGVRFYDRGVSSDLGEWSYVTQGGFPLRDVGFLPLE